MAEKKASGNSRKTRQGPKTYQGKRQPKLELSEVAKSLQLLTQKLESIEERLRRVESASGVDAPELVWSSLTEVREKPGRRRAYPLRDILARRDAIVEFLEMNWPEIKVAIRHAKKAADLWAVFGSARKPLAALTEPEFVRSPSEYLDQFWQFSQSRWYSNSPRRLADAMAGLPRLSWKRSFDICNASPCIQIVGTRARRDMLQRKFPQRFRELCGASSESEIVAILRRSRTKDSTYLQLLDNPQLVVECLRVGKVGILS